MIYTAYTVLMGN